MFNCKKQFSLLRINEKLKESKAKETLLSEPQST